MTSRWCRFYFPFSRRSTGADSWARTGARKGARTGALTVQPCRSLLSGRPRVVQKMSPINIRCFYNVLLIPACAYTTNHMYNDSWMAIFAYNQSKSGDRCFILGKQITSSFGPVDFVFRVCAFRSQPFTQPIFDRTQLFLKYIR